MATALKSIKPFPILSMKRFQYRPGTAKTPLSFMLNQRHITNATKPDYVSNLHQVQRVPEKPGGWMPTLIHSSGEVKWSVIRLKPGGGEVPRHSHDKVWDYFIPLEGEAVIETETSEGERKDFEMSPGRFLALEPWNIHRVRNVSAEREFVFLIAQAPRGEYNFVAK